MSQFFTSDSDLLRAEIAAAAARMIAEDGMDYSNAKRKAAKQILGNQKVRGDILPDNAQIEDEVRVYQQLFFGESQPLRLLHLRKLAYQLMQDLVQFQPFLTGAALNGTAGEHSDIHLHLFADSPKDVEIYLLNKDIAFDVSEAPHPTGRKEAVEVVSFMWRNEGIHLTLYSADDLHRLGKGNGGRPVERADLDTLARLIAQSEPT